MSRDSVLAQGRAKVAESFRETITAGKYVETVVDTQTVRTLVGALHYSGPASIDFPTLTASETDVASQTQVEIDVTVKTPVSAAIPPGDIVIVTASTSDAGLVGREFRVKAPPQSGQVTSHRHPVVELP